MVTFTIWGLALLLIAILAFFILGWFYLAGTFKPQLNYKLSGIPAQAPTYLMTLASMSDSLMTQGRPTQFWSDIDAIQTARLKLIDQAQSLILFETFKMSPGKRADDFAEALCRQARRGVKVQVLADAYGAHELPQTYWTQLQNAGVAVRFFNPFSARHPLGYVRRNHRKLLLIDQQIAMVGGAGMSDLWDGQDRNPETIPWYDFELEWRGAVVGLLTGFFWQHWLSVGGEVNLADHQSPPADEASDAVLLTPGEEPSTGDSPIRALFQLAILSAQERLWIASPYLLPDQTTCRMLASVRERGVDVRILTMGPKSDKPYVYYTSRARYRPLLEQGIKIHEYQPSMMHGKLVLIDHHWASLGSANLDPRSFFHNDELNLCTRDSQILQQVENFLRQGFAQSQLIQLKDWRQRSFKERFMGWLGNIFYWQF